MFKKSLLNEKLNIVLQLYKIIINLKQNEEYVTRHHFQQFVPSFSSRRSSCQKCPIDRNYGKIMLQNRVLEVNQRIHRQVIRLRIKFNIYIFYMYLN
jgi:hypothetical protein